MRVLEEKQGKVFEARFEMPCGSSYKAIQSKEGLRVRVAGATKHIPFSHHQIIVAYLKGRAHADA